MKQTIQKLREKIERRRTWQIAIFVIVILAGALAMKVVEENKVEVRTVDGCQYIVNHVDGGEVLTHKGDCKSSTHKNGKIINTR